MAFHPGVGADFAFLLTQLRYLGASFNGVATHITERCVAWNMPGWPGASVTPQQCRRIMFREPCQCC